jgi:hypothetical protein
MIPGLQFQSVFAIRSLTPSTFSKMANFGFETTGTEIVDAFSDQVRGRTCKKSCFPMHYRFSNEQSLSPGPALMALEQRPHTASQELDLAPSSWQAGPCPKYDL